MTVSFREPTYMFVESIGVATVCVDKVGNTAQTIMVMVSGRKLVDTIAVTYCNLLAQFVYILMYTIIL